LTFENSEIFRFYRKKQFFIKYGEKYINYYQLGEESGRPLGCVK
jgi:hypothetical protein